MGQNWGRILWTLSFYTIRMSGELELKVLK